MATIAFLLGFTLMVALVLTALLASYRLKSRVASEGRALTALARTPDAAALVPLASLPTPVRRYLELAGAERKPIGFVRLVHTGTARSKPDAKPMTIRGEEILTADPPGFVWHGRMQMAPGLWVDARDRSVEGKANMLVLLESAIVLNDAHGPELDQGAAVRLLGELAWLPTAYRDTRWVRWTAIDDTTARATLMLGGREYAADFHFASDGMPSRVTAERYRDVEGRGVLTPWEGRLFDYRRVSGLLVPFQVEASWLLEGGKFTPFHFVVQKIEIDPAPDKAREVTASLAAETP